MEEVSDERAELVERIAALDIGKASLVCCVRVPHESKPGARRQEVRTYSTTTPALLGLRDWLICQGVTQVVMEATPVIRGNEDQVPRSRRSCSRVRVRDGKSKIGSHERLSRGERCGRLSASRTVPQITRPRRREKRTKRGRHPPSLTSVGGPR